MKLTKAQRLFVAVGQVQNELMLQKAYHAPWDEDKEESGKYIKEYKARRKRLIRKALEAWQQAQDSTVLRALNEQLID